jgi:glycerol-3-phosphate acyltransferase PlsY
MKLNLLLLYLGSYLCGGIPFGVIFAKMKGIDLLKVGSGNIGATNVKRALGAKFAFCVFLLDVAKAAVPAALARLVVQHELHGVPAQVFWVLAGLMAVFGHCVSPFLRFKGGKGVSTALGMVLGAAPMVALCGFSLFLVLLFTTGYMSLASIIAVSSAIVFGWVLPGQARELLPLYVLLSVFVAIRHKPNIIRLMNGTEPKFSLTAKEPEQTDEDTPG